MKYTTEQLAEILAKHKKWIDDDDDGERADLSRADLSCSNLSGADLSCSNLSGANLYGSNLSGAILYGSNLSRADLSGANLSGAILYGSNLSGANLSGADLSRASLSCSNLSGANLSGADLYRADLSGANLSGVGSRDVNTFLSVAGIGREGRQTLYWVEEDKIWCGCFRGTLAEFEAKVSCAHGDSVHGQNYRDAIAFFKSVMSRIEK